MATKPVVAGTDGSAESLRAVEWAAREAALTVVHAWHGPSADGAADAAAGQLAELLASWQAKYPDAPVSQEIVRGHPGRVLAGLSARADLIVLGGHAPHGPGLHGPGMVTHAVLNHAHGCVVTVPSSRQSPRSQP